MQFGEDRLGRHEQEGRVLGLAGDQIFVGDGAHMHVHVAAHPAGGEGPRLVALGLVQGGEGFQRKLRVDGQRRRAVRHADQAVRPLAVRERRLEGIGGRRQRVGNDRLHPPFAEGAAALLVGQNVLQPDDLAGEPADLALRPVDRRQPFRQGG